MEICVCTSARQNRKLMRETEERKTSLRNWMNRFLFIDKVWCSELWIYLVSRLFTYSAFFSIWFWAIGDVSSQMSVRASTRRYSMRRCFSVRSISFRRKNFHYDVATCALLHVVLIIRALVSSIRTQIRPTFLCYFCLATRQNDGTIYMKLIHRNICTRKREMRFDSLRIIVIFFENERDAQQDRTTIAILLFGFWLDFFATRMSVTFKRQQKTEKINQFLWDENDVNFDAFGIAAVVIEWCRFCVSFRSLIWRQFRLGVSFDASFDAKD